MTAAALAAAGLPLALLPEKRIFLPPARGWFQSPLRMREVRQYLINNDTMPMRYDVAWDVHQWHVDFPGIEWSLEKTDPKLFAELLEDQRSIARQTFERIRREHGYNRADARVPPLPRGFSEDFMDSDGIAAPIVARYV
jgi:hypothetical protein